MAVSKRLEHRVLDTQESLHPDDLDGFGHRKPSAQVIASDTNIELIQTYLDTNRLSEAKYVLDLGIKNSNSHEYVALENRINESIQIAESLINKFIDNDGDQYLGALRVAIETGLYSKIDSIIELANEHYSSPKYNMGKIGFINSARKIVSKAIEKSNLVEFYKHLKNDAVKEAILTKQQLTDMEYRDIEHLDKYAS